MSRPAAPPSRSNPPSAVAQKRVVAALAIVVMLALAALCAAAWWIRLGMPVALVDAPTGRIACVSYAPFRKAGESPFTRGYRVTPERIDEDLAALSRRFDCVRTYSVGQGLDQVPAIARRHGMKVLLGVWLSRNAVENAEELTLGIELAKRERGVISAIVVGNEVLLRGELPQSTLAGHLRAVRVATGLPVTYADVWEFWIKYREVAPAVDFITIHILPYWEDEPVAIGSAIAHVDAIYRQMRARFPGREFLIGETGWPSAGRQRWGAVPSRVNEARFFREFMRFVEREKLRYNVIEAFDQPWKRALEGTVGGYWGLYDDDLNDKFPMTGPVVEDPRWWVGVVAGLAGAVGFVIAGLVSGSRFASVATLARALAGFLVAALAAAQVRHFLFANRNAFEACVMTAATVLALVTALWVFDRVARWLDRRAGAQVACPPLAAALRVRGVPGAFAGLTQGFWLVAATVVNLLLVFDARYRDFPSLLFAPVIVAFAVLAMTRYRGNPWRRPREVEECVLVIGLALGAAVTLVMELPINASADLWSLLCVLFAGAAWINGRDVARDG